MTTSGSVDFSISRDEIIRGALRKNGVISRGQTPSAEDISEGSEALNLIVKQWQSNSDFAPGLKVWSRKRGTIFPALNEREYSLGPNGDHATSSYRSTTVSAAEAIGQTVISITSTSGMANSDNIGIRCNDGSIHWSTVSSFVANTTVTIASALTVAAAAGSTIYYYTTKLLMPLHVISLRRKQTTGSETSLDPMSVDDYESIGDKTVNGTPVRYLYESGITDGTLFLDYGVSDTTDVFQITFLRTIEDFDSSSDTPDFPQGWYRPLLLQLAIDLAPERGKSDRIPPLQLLLHGNKSMGIPGALEIAQNADPENSMIFFQAET